MRHRPAQAARGADGVELRARTATQPHDPVGAHLGARGFTGNAPIAPGCAPTQGRCGTGQRKRLAARTVSNSTHARPRNPHDPVGAHLGAKRLHR